MVRRTFLLSVGLVGLGAAGFYWAGPAASQVNTVKEVAPGVYFHEGDLHGHGHCNNGWIVFDDYVLVVDGNFPSGARVVIPKIKAITKKPIRFAFDTHHHGDHAYGNQVWVDEGAIPVAHEGVLAEMKKYETGYFGGKPGRWEDAAKTREDVRNSRLKPPTLLFPKELLFDDGTRRLELKWLGVAHTHGDGWGWMPKERILFGGDACVNGPYNYVGDGNITAWVKTLDQARKLGARIVVPGHGPVGDGSLVEDQRAYFLELLSQGRRLLASHQNPAEAAAQVDRIKAEVQSKKQIQRYVGDFFPAQLEKAYVESGGKAWPQKMSSVRRGSRLAHAEDHRLTLRELGPPTEWRSRLAGR